MYQVRKVHIHEGWSEVWREVASPSEAYELAHQLQAATWGLCNSDDLNKEHQGPYTVHITRGGKSAWGECSRARCPTPKGVAVP